MSASAVPAPVIIYPAQSLMSLLSRAWNLLRTNLKSSLLLMMGPTILITAFHLLVSLLSSQTFLTPTSAAGLTFTLLIVLACILLALPCFFFWIFSCCALSRLYYSAIVSEAPITIRACWHYLQKIWLPLTLLIVALSVILFIFIIVNFLILYLGILLSVLVLTGLGLATGNFQHLGPGVTIIFFLLIWGFVVLAATISMISFQGFFFAFPLLAISTATNIKTTWWQHLSKSYKLLFENIHRIIPFAMILFFFSWILLGVLMSPAWIWSILELARLGINQQDHIPMHIQTVVNIWSSLANLLVLPFHISALTLFWYDCLVRKEGLDLKIWFNRILRRQGKNPDEYMTTTDLQVSF
jgi:hypothetical protein